MTKKTLYINVSDSSQGQNIYKSPVVLTLLFYSRIPISLASKGNENWFEKLGVRNFQGYKITVKQIQVKQIQGKRLLVPAIGVILRNQRFEKSGFRCSISPFQRRLENKTYLTKSACYPLISWTGERGKFSNDLYDINCAALRGGGLY